MSNKYKEYTKKKKAITVILIALSVVLAGVVTYLVGKPLIGFASEPEVFREWVDSHGVWGKVFFIGVNTLQIILAFIPGEPVEVAAGYAFGAFEGTVLCLIASAIGGTIVFWLVRILGKRLVNIFFEDETLDKLKFLRKSPARDLLFFIIFFIPGTPKDLLCYTAGLTDIKFYVWLVICTVGRIPSIITSTVGGNALGTQRYTFAAVVLIVTLIISGIGLLVYRHITKKAADDAAREEAAEAARIEAAEAARIEAADTADAEAPYAPGTGEDSVSPKTAAEDCAKTS